MKIAIDIQKWLANTLFVFAMVSLLSPVVAATAVTPWVVFFLVNLIYLFDALKHKNWPWLSLCVFCGAWDILLVVSRITKTNVFEILAPIVAILEQLP